MQTVFVLLIFLGNGLQSSDTFFADIDDCLYFAKRIMSNPPNPKGKASKSYKAICEIRKVDPSLVIIHR
jgi:hypothetical protein